MLPYIIYFEQNIVVIRAHQLNVFDNQFSRRTNAMQRRLFFSPDDRTPTGSAHVVTERTQYIMDINY